MHGCAHACLWPDLCVRMDVSQALPAGKLRSLQGPGLEQCVGQALRQCRAVGPLPTVSASKARPRTECKHCVQQAIPFVTGLPTSGKMTVLGDGLTQLGEGPWSLGSVQAQVMGKGGKMSGDDPGLHTWTQRGGSDRQKGCKHPGLSPWQPQSPAGRLHLQC